MPGRSSRGEGAQENRWYHLEGLIELLPYPRYELDLVDDEHAKSEIS